MEIREGGGQDRRFTPGGLEWTPAPLPAPNVFSALGERAHCAIVAEIGNIHDGSEGEAHALIDAAAAAGVDAVKLQAHIADAESSEAEQFPERFGFHPQDQTRTAYWRRMEFSRSAWERLTLTARSLSVELIVSTFSVEAVERVADLVDRLKIASGELDNGPMIEAIRQTGLPVVLSTGMSNRDQIGSVIAWALQAPPRERLTLLQCTSRYPCPMRDIGLNMVWEYSRNPCHLGGLSDHSGAIWPGVGAALLGAHMIEVHICWSKSQFGVDATSSLTIDELRELVAGVRAMCEIRDNPVNKDMFAARLHDIAAYTEGKRR